jgi:hypothetical protein
MQRFRLYHQGDLAAAVKPRVGLRGQTLYFGVGPAPSPPAKRN